MFRFVLDVYFDFQDCSHHFLLQDFPNQRLKHSDARSKKFREKLLWNSVGIRIPLSLKFSSLPIVDVKSQMICRPFKYLYGFRWQGHQNTELFSLVLKCYLNIGTFYNGNCFDHSNTRLILYRDLSRLKIVDFASFRLLTNLLALSYPCHDKKKFPK